MLQRLSGDVDGQVVRLPRCLELPCHFKPSHHSELAALACSPVDVVLGPGVVSQSPDGRRRCPVCHSASSWRYTRAVRAHCRELRGLNRCLPITARGRHHVYALV